MAPQYTCTIWKWRICPRQHKVEEAAAPTGQLPHMRTMSEREVAADAKRASLKDLVLIKNKNKEEAMGVGNDHDTEDE